jgi:hypothetical protein
MTALADKQGSLGELEVRAAGLLARAALWVPNAEIVSIVEHEPWSARRSVLVVLYDEATASTYEAVVADGRLRESRRVVV